MLGLQGGSSLVARYRKGGPNLNDLLNFRTSSATRKAARRARVILDLFFLILTMSCLGFALYRSLH